MSRARTQPTPEEYGTMLVGWQGRLPKILVADERILIADTFLTGANGEYSPWYTLDGNIVTFCDVVYEITGWDDEQQGHAAIRREPAPAPARRQRPAQVAQA